MTSRPRAPWHAARRARPRLELLEDRTAPAVFVVNSLADGTPAIDGQLTLREAITAATTNGASGDAPAGETNPDTIVFASNLQGGTLTLTQGELVLDGGGDLSIIGPGAVADGITLNGNNATRVFNVSSPDAVVLSSLTITGGNAGDGTDGGGVINSGANLTLGNARVTNNVATDDGGGIDNGGTLTLTGVEVSNNSAGGDGGGVFNNNGTLTIQGGSRIVTNTAGGEGGGIHTQGTGGPLLISETTAAGNVSARGGGLEVVGTATTVLASTFSGNRAAGDGGGLSFRASPTADVVNSTVAENISDANGGGIDIESGTVNLTQVTIVGNAATAAGGGIDQDSGTVTTNNSILTGNLAATGGTDQRRTLAGTFTGSNNLEGGNPRLSPLQDNGGPTFTMVPLPGSPAIGAGSNSLSLGPDGSMLTTDQRGFPRLIGSNVDQGAVESFSPATTTTLVVLQDGAEVSETSTARRINLVAGVAASVGSVVPQGNVIFFDDATPGDPTDAPIQLNPIPIPLSSVGQATLPGVTLSAGAHNLTARFLPSSEALSPSASQARSVTARLIDTVGVFDPGSVAFQLLNRNANSPTGPDFGYPFGFIGASPVVGNWTGAPSRVSLPGQVNILNGLLRWELSDENPPVLPNLPAFFYGAVGQVPIAGDWDGDGQTGIGVYDSDRGAFLLRNLPTDGPPDFSFAFGAPGQLPVVGNWDGTGGDEVGVYNPATGQWALAASNPLEGLAPLFTQFTFGGQIGSRPVAGDWDGNGTDGIGVFFPQPSGFGGFLLKNEAAAGSPDVNGGDVILAGLTTWLPLTGNWGPAPTLTNELLNLTAAGGPGGGQALSAEQLGSAVGAALDRLGAAGVDPGVLQALARAQFVVGDLPGAQLAAADVANGRVIVDVDGAGSGWYIDPTPADGEFPSGDGAGYDLLTAVLHEMGHLAGHGHHDEGLMGETLRTGMRSMDALDAVFALGFPA
jgi:hypothetical protein